MLRASLLLLVGLDASSAAHLSAASRAELRPDVWAPKVLSAKTLSSKTKTTVLPAVTQPAATVLAAPASAVQALRTGQAQHEAQVLDRAAYLSGNLLLVLKFLCIVSNVLFQLSPFARVLRFKAEGSTGDADPAPIVSIAFASCQFLFYGAFAFVVTGKAGFLVLVYSNIIGVVVGFFYSVSYWSYCSDPIQRQLFRNYLRGACTVALMEAICVSMLPKPQALLLIGFVSSSWSLVSTAALIVPLPEVIRTRCSKLLSVPMLVANEVSGILWTLCGLALGDMYIAVPNIVCTLINTVGMILALSLPRVLEDEACKETVQEDMAPKAKPEAPVMRATTVSAAGSDGETGGTTGETGGTPNDIEVAQE